MATTINKGEIGREMIEVLDGVTLEYVVPVSAGGNLEFLVKNNVSAGVTTGAVDPTFKVTSSRAIVTNNNFLRLEPVTSDPGGPVEGDIYYDSTLKKLRCYNGTSWNNLF